MKKTLLFTVALCLATSVTAAEKGYLSDNEIPNSEKILPPPPSMHYDGGDQPMFSQDKVITESLFINKYYLSNNAYAIPESRIKQAIDDANKTPSYFLDIYIDDLDILEEEKISIKEELYDIVEKVIFDGNNATSKAKKHYSRERPYSYYNIDSCQMIDDESRQKALSKTHVSYPSGHTSRGMTVAYVLADILPEKHREKILSRGMDYADSRVICGAHWQSDIEAGRVVAQATFDKLKANPNYIKDTSNFNI